MTKMKSEKKGNKLPRKKITGGGPLGELEKGAEGAAKEGEHVAEGAAKEGEHAAEEGEHVAEEGEHEIGRAHV